MSAADVKDLREKTGAGFMDCKKALLESNGNMEKAIEYLRKKGIQNAEKRAGRTTSQGRVHSYIHGEGRIGVLLETNCETDFVANTDEFKVFINDVAMHIAATNPRFLDTNSVPKEILEKEKEILKEQLASSGKPQEMLNKIVEGKIRKWFEENCLLHQAFVKDPDKSIESLQTEMIAKIGENISIRRFVRYELGETL